MTILAERAALMGQDYRLAHPLMQGCAKEIHEFNCGPQSKSADIPEHFHLSWVLLCLENAAHTSNKVGQQCHHEMMTHRQMMMSEYRLSPEIVLTCSQVIFIII
jgi:Golgi apparatus protein 1